MTHGSPARRRPVFIAAAAILLVVACLFGFAATAHAQAVTYDSLPSPLPPNVPSQAFEATSTSQFGDHIRFVNGVGGQLQSATVLMSSWACEEGGWTTGCTTTPGATYAHEITLNLYAVDASGGQPVAGALLASRTATFDIPYRPSSDPTCADTTTYPPTDSTAPYRWYDAASDACANGLAFPITFMFDEPVVMLPGEVIFGVAFNTTHYGAAPIGEGASCYSQPAGCGYDSLNVGVGETDVFGTDVEPAAAFLSSTSSGAYCDGGDAGTGAFRYDGDCWEPYVPNIRFVMDGPVIIVPDSTISLPTGSSAFELPVMFNPKEYKVAGATFSLAYDSACLNVALTPGAGLPAGTDFGVNEFTGLFEVALTTPALDPQTAVALGAGELVHLAVTVLPACRTDRVLDFTFASRATCGDEHGVDLPCGTEDGAVTLDFNDAPTGVTLSPLQFSGTQAPGAILGTFSLVDNDPTPPVVCEFVAPVPPASLLAIENDQLRVGTNPLGAGQYSFLARCADNGGLYSQAAEFTISVFGTAELDIGGENPTRPVPDPVAISYPYVAREGNTMRGVEVVYDHMHNPADRLVFTVSEESACVDGFSIESRDSRVTASRSGNQVTLTTPGSTLPMGALVTLSFNTASCPGLRNDVPLDLQVQEYSAGGTPLSIAPDDGMIITIENSERGDCNASGSLSSGDFVATVLEIFGQDPALDPANFWLDAPRFGHAGSPLGCDSTQSAYVEVGDLVCTVRLSFGMSCASQGHLQEGIYPASSAAAVLAAEADDTAAAIALEANGNTPAALSFRIVLDPGAAFDASDADGDGNVDAVQFAGGSNLLRMAHYDAATRSINVAVVGVVTPLPLIEGAIATVNLAGVDGFHFEDVSVAGAEGETIPTIARVGVDDNMDFRLFLPSLPQ